MRTSYIFSQFFCDGNFSSFPMGQGRKIQIDVSLFAWTLTGSQRAITYLFTVAWYRSSCLTLTWFFSNSVVMSPSQSAHAVGKVLKFVWQKSICDSSTEFWLLCLTMKWLSPGKRQYRRKLASNTKRIGNYTWAHPAANCNWWKVSRFEKFHVKVKESLNFWKKLGTSWKVPYRYTTLGN